MFCAESKREKIKWARFDLSEYKNGLERRINPLGPINRFSKINCWNHITTKSEYVKSCIYNICHIAAHNSRDNRLTPPVNCATLSGMATNRGEKFRVPADYPARIRSLRETHKLTQQRLADLLGVSFATVNRWENKQTKPSRLYWTNLKQLELRVAEEMAAYDKTEPPAPAILDFTAQPEIVKVLAEGERLSFGHLMNPAFATEISSIDPLPHQRIAVYDHMLIQPRLRFLLADDAGAGKTIMSGLYIREMLSRRLLRRILIVPPAGLVGNWRRELLTLFNLPFRIVTGADARADNPFLGEAGDRVIVSVDTLASPRVFARLRETAVAPYDLVIFDEAHKLAADRGNDLRVRKTGRYCLAEALAGAQVQSDHWRLGWCAHHLLLLTATPHMGKAYPYYALWRLLEPEMLATPDAFEVFPREQRQAHFIRRTKEEMVFLDGRRSIRSACPTLSATNSAKAK